MGNLLNLSSCAITDSAKAALGAQHGDVLQIAFDQKNVFLRRIDDRAPESDERVDLFFPYAFNTSIPTDFANVTLA